MQMMMRPMLGLLALIVMPPRWLRLFALLMAVSGVAMLFHLGSKPFASGLFPHPLDKFVHLTAFGGLGATLWVMLGGRGKLADHGALILACLVGTADETFQRLLPTREASMADLLFDMLGVFLAIGLLVSARFWLTKGRDREY